MALVYCTKIVYARQLHVLKSDTRICEWDPKASKANVFGFGGAELRQNEPELFSERPRK
jgi:hypothetical protein